jgi:hypothetical protein
MPTRLIDRELQDRHMKKLHEKWKKENLNKLNNQFKNAA